MTELPTNDSRPPITVIIPVYNGATVIEDCLAALVRQTVKRDRYEIIVVDDGSIDLTLTHARKYEDVRTVTQPHGGPAAARNHGVTLAKGELVVFTDADCVPDRCFLEKICKPLFED